MAGIEGPAVFTGESVNDRNSEPSVAARIAALRQLKAQQRQTATAVASYQAVTDGIRELTWSVPAVRVYPLVVAHLELGRQLTRVPGSSERIAASMAQVALTAGRLALLDLGVEDDADAHFIESAMAAYRASDPLLTAGALSHRGLVASSAGHHEKARSLVADAASAAVQADGGRTRLNAWLDTVSAQVEVAAGAPRKAMALIASARRHARGGQQSQAPVWLDFFDDARLEAACGAVELAAGQPELAAVALQRALRDLPPCAAKVAAAILADLAEVRRVQQDPEEACRLLVRALVATQDHVYLAGLSRIRRTRRALPAATATGALRSVDTLLDGWTAIDPDGARGSAVEVIGREV